MNIKSHTVKDWCDIFGIEMIDPDGFRGIVFDKTEIHLTMFLDGINVCTICPINKDKYSVMNELTK